MTATTWYCGNQRRTDLPRSGLSVYSEPTSSPVFCWRLLLGWNVLYRFCCEISYFLLCRWWCLCTLMLGVERVHLPFCLLFQLVYLPVQPPIATRGRSRPTLSGVSALSASDCSLCGLEHRTLMGVQGVEVEGCPTWKRDS